MRRYQSFVNLASPSRWRIDKTCPVQHRSGAIAVDCSAAVAIAVDCFARAQRGNLRAPRAIGFSKQPTSTNRFATVVVLVCSARATCRRRKLRIFLFFAPFRTFGTSSRATIRWNRRRKFLYISDALQRRRRPATPPPPPGQDASPTRDGAVHQEENAAEMSDCSNMSSANNDSEDDDPCRVHSSGMSSSGQPCRRYELSKSELRKVGNARAPIINDIDVPRRPVRDVLFFLKILFLW